MLYDRVYRLLVGKKGQSAGIEIDDLHITFSIEKTTKKNPNSSNIKIWNLQKSTRQEMEKPDTRCLLYAGYKDEAGAILIFNGGVTYAWSHREGPDIITEFELGDGAQEIRDTTISVGYNKGIKSTQILNDVASKMGLPLSIPGNVLSRIWNNGLSFYGPARNLMDKVTKGTGLEWSIQNGNVQVIEQGMVTTREGIVIAQDSGLVGSPQRERQSNSHTHKKGAGGETGGPIVQPDYDGWKVKSLLQPSINPGDRIKLEALDVNGIFRVEQINHTGDSDAAGEWQSELRVVDPAKPITSKSSGSKQSRGSVDTSSDTFYDDSGFC